MCIGTPVGFCRFVPLVSQTVNRLQFPWRAQLPSLPPLPWRPHLLHWIPPLPWQVQLPQLPWRPRLRRCYAPEPTPEPAIRLRLRLGQRLSQRLSQCQALR